MRDEHVIVHYGRHIYAEILAPTRVGLVKYCCLRSYSQQHEKNTSDTETSAPDLCMLARPPSYSITTPSTMTGPEESPCRILVMASGFGSNFQALIDAISTGQLPNSQIISLVTNRKNAHASVRADEAGRSAPMTHVYNLLLIHDTGIPWDYFNPISNGFLRKGESDPHKLADGRQKYDAALAARILSADRKRPELIVLAGWMHVFSVAFLEPIERAGIRVINLHPALPRKFYEMMLGLAFLNNLYRGV